MEDSRPFWEMSQIDINQFGRYDWLYRHPAPQPKIILSDSQLKKIQKSIDPPPKKSNEYKDPADNIELVGYKPSEYKFLPTRPPLKSGRKVYDDFNNHNNIKFDAFKDMHTPIQVTKRFSGSPIISVPITSGLRSRKTTSRKSTSRSKRSENALPIHDVLFEESINPREDIDPWGYSRDEKVDKQITFHGMKLGVSRLRPPK